MSSSRPGNQAQLQSQQMIFSQNYILMQFDIAVASHTNVIQRNYTVSTASSLISIIILLLMGERHNAAFHFQMLSECTRRLHYRLHCVQFKQ